MNASDAAAALHERTKHTWQRLRTEAHGLDWGNHPFPFKLYPDLEPLALPRQLPESSLPATQVLSGHASASTLDLAGLAWLLFFSAGVTRILHRVLFRAAPSAGALYPTELYAVCGPLPDLPAGVCHFEPAEFALRRLRDGDFRPAWPPPRRRPSLGCRCAWCSRASPAARSAGRWRRPPELSPAISSHRRRRCSSTSWPCTRWRSCR
jgi:hypothetical protein